MHEGSLIADKYRLVSLLGEGGMGSVWRAEHLGLNAPVAVKLLNQLVAATSEGLARFHREAQAAAALRSPHVVQIFDHGVDPVSNQPFIVMELMEGESLASRIAREGRLLPEATARVVTQIARALGRAHEAGIVHRDLKPDNVFLVRNDDEEIAKVLDFGIAKSQAHRLGNDSATRTGAVMGTPYYMSPEQISGSKGVDYRTDLWALAVIACECLTGRRPFDAETIGGLALKICAEPMPQPSSLGQVPGGFDAWFARAASRDTVGRFASAREMADELKRVCSGGVVTNERPATAVPALQPAVHTASTGALVRTAAGTTEASTAARSPSRSWLVAAAAGVLLLGAGVGVWQLVSAGSDAAAAASAAPEVSAPGAVVPAKSEPAPAEVAPNTAAPVVAVAPSAAMTEPSAASPAAVPTTPPASRPARPTPRPDAKATSTAKPASVATVAPAVAAVVPTVAVKTPVAVATEKTPASKPGALSRPSGIGTAISERR